MDIDWTAVAVIATALGTVLGSVAARRKISSEAANEISEAAISLLDPFRRRLEELETQIEAQNARTQEQQAQIADLRSQVEMLQRENAQLRQGVDLLIKQIVELGQRPSFHPPWWKESHE